MINCNITKLLLIVKLLKFVLAHCDKEKNQIHVAYLPNTVVKKWNGDVVEWGRWGGGDPTMTTHTYKIIQNQHSQWPSGQG